MTKCQTETRENYFHLECLRALSTQDRCGRGDAALIGGQETGRRVTQQVREGHSSSEHAPVTRFLQLGPTFLPHLLVWTPSKLRPVVRSEPLRI